MGTGQGRIKAPALAGTPLQPLLKLYIFGFFMLMKRMAFTFRRFHILTFPLLRFSGPSLASSAAIP